MFWQNFPLPCVFPERDFFGAISPDFSVHWGPCKGNAQVCHRTPWWVLSIEKTTYLATLRWGYPIKVMSKYPIEDLGGFCPLKRPPTWQLCFGDTVNVYIFAQYIFSCISRRALDARPFEVSKNYNHNRTTIIKWYVRKNVTT